MTGAAGRHAACAGAFHKPAKGGESKKQAAVVRTYYTRVVFADPLSRIPKSEEAEVPFRKLGSEKHSLFVEVHFRDVNVSKERGGAGAAPMGPAILAHYPLLRP